MHDSDRINLIKDVMEILSINFHCKFFRIKKPFNEKYQINEFIKSVKNSNNIYHKNYFK